jgi:hypothetical protein
MNCATSNKRAKIAYAIYDIDSFKKFPTHA